MICALAVQKDCCLYSSGRGPNGAAKVTPEFWLSLLNRQMPYIDDQVSDPTEKVLTWIERQKATQRLGVSERSKAPSCLRLRLNGVLSGIRHFSALSPSFTEVSLSVAEMSLSATLQLWSGLVPEHSVPTIGSTFGDSILP